MGITALLWAWSLAPATSAVLISRVANPGGVATAALSAPTGLSAAAAGHDVALGWTAGQNGSGYAVEGAATGASNDCSGAAFAPVGSAPGIAYTDVDRFTPQGTFYCYRVTTTYGTTWTSVAANPSVAVRIGFVTTSASVANGGLGSTLDTGDRIVLDFNQAVDAASGPQSSSTVCAATLGIIVVGSTTPSGACSAGETATVGKLSGGTLTVGGRWIATYTWSNAGKTLTVVLGGRTNGLLPTTALGSWTFTPTATATKLLSATGGSHICDTNAGGGSCVPAASGAF